VVHEYYDIETAGASLEDLEMETGGGADDDA
jgi:hypothetical protein